MRWYGPDMAREHAKDEEGEKLQVCDDINLIKCVEGCGGNCPQRTVNVLWSHFFHFFKAAQHEFVVRSWLGLLRICVKRRMVSLWLAVLMVSWLKVGGPI